MHGACCFSGDVNSLDQFLFLSTANASSQMETSVFKLVDTACILRLNAHDAQDTQCLADTSAAVPVSVPCPCISTKTPKPNTGKTIWQDLSSKDRSFGSSGLLYCALKPAECQIHAQTIQHQMTLYCVILCYVTSCHTVRECVAGCRSL